MNDVSATINRGMVQRVTRIFVAILLLGSGFFALACRASPLSKPPTLSEYKPDGVMLHYVNEFSQMGQKGYRTLDDLDHTPEQSWQVYADRERPDGVSEDFFGVKLRNKEAGESRLLFTLWAADVGSGIRARVRWSTDGKALQIIGETQGFSFEPIPYPGSSNLQSFNFIYLVDEDKMYSVPRGGV